MTLSKSQLKKIHNILEQGGVVAYPTEAVYGLGCNPFNKNAVEKIKTLKGRQQKAFILISDDFAKIQSLILPPEPHRMELILRSWPGPVTYVFEAARNLPDWLKALDGTIAVRISGHETVKQICEKLPYPIVSTSANLSGNAPAKNSKEIEAYFANQIDLIVPGALGTLLKPTKIIDAQTGKVIRE